MKTVIAAFLITATTLGTTAAAAATFTPEQQLSLAGIAIKDFKKDSPEHFAHFNGAKFWPSGENVKVKIYVDHDGHAMEFTYLCHSHDGETECHVQ